MRKDWTGKVFGRLTICSPTDQRYHDGSIMWEAKCTCGKKKLVVPRELQRYHTSSCGCYNLELSRSKAFELHKKKRKYDPWISSAKSVYKTHYTECDFDVFLKLSQSPCYYCGRPPYRTYNVGWNYKSSKFQQENGNFTYNGLDRVDCSKGHTSDNVVPCCIECNQAKNDLSLKEFLIHIERIFIHTKELRESMTDTLKI